MKHIVFDIHGVLLEFSIEKYVVPLLMADAQVRQWQAELGYDDQQLEQLIIAGKKKSKEVLAQYCSLCSFKPCRQSFASGATDHGLPLPHIQEAWERGLLSNEAALQAAEHSFDYYATHEQTTPLELHSMRTYVLYHTSVQHFLAVIKEIPGAQAFVNSARQTYPSAAYSLLSNGRSEWYPFYLERYQPLFAPFTHTFFSNEIHLLKPDQRIFELPFFKQFPLEETVLIDDRSENVDSARRAGMKGILFDADDMQSAYTELRWYA